MKQLIYAERSHDAFPGSSARSRAGGLVLAIGLIGLAPTGFAGSIPTTGLVAYYDFNGTTTDAIGGHDGTIFGGVTFDRGVLGQAAEFKGAGYISVPNSPDFRMLNSDSKTFSFWASLQSGWKEGIIGKRTAVSGGPLDGFALFKEEAHFRPVVEADPPGSIGTIGEFIPVVNVWNWTYLTFVKTPGNWSVYQNGQLLNLAPVGAYGTSGDWPTSLDTEVDRPLTFGATDINPDGSLAYGDRAIPLVGLLDDLRIYDRALDATEIQTLYASYPTPLTPPVLSAQLPEGGSWWYLTGPVGMLGLFALCQRRRGGTEPQAN